LQGAGCPEFKEPGYPNSVEITFSNQDAGHDFTENLTQLSEECARALMATFRTVPQPCPTFKDTDGGTDTVNAVPWDGDWWPAIPG
jgi:hypothetical protein